MLGFLSSRVISWLHIWIVSQKTVSTKTEFGNVKHSLTLKIVTTNQLFFKEKISWLQHLTLKYLCKLFRFFFQIYNLSALRWKGESQNGGSKKTKHAKLSEKTNNFFPLIQTCAYQGIRNVRFSENFVCFVFLFWDSLFCLITDKFRIKLEFPRK